MNAFSFRLAACSPFRVLAVSLLISTALISTSDARSKGPTVEETEAGRVLVLPDDLRAHLDGEFPTALVVPETDFDPEMLKFYYRNLVGVHPAIAFGDFNGDKRDDYALLLITGQSPWGPVVELIVLNGRKRGRFETFNLGEIYNHKTDYVQFRGGKLYKGKYRRNGWRINWDEKKKDYVILK